LAAQTIGFTAFNDENEIRGRYGLESYYEDILMRDHKNTFSNFFVEIFSKTAETMKNNNEVDGSIVTTIEPEVQSFVDEELIFRKLGIPKKPELLLWIQILEQFVRWLLVLILI